MLTEDEAQQTEELTIDELARRTGVTVRNIRAHQSRGLLPPPDVRSRTGYYGAEHVARLELIRELQAEGFTLKSIRRLLDQAPDAGAEVLGFTRALMSPYGDERPEYVSREDVEAKFGAPLDPKIMGRAERLGLFVPLGDDRWEVPSPTLLRAGEEVVAMGVPVTHALGVLERINRHSRAVAETFVRLFRDDVLRPLERRADDPARWSEAQAALERIRPLATEALLAGFSQMMSRATEEAFGKELER